MNVKDIFESMDYGPAPEDKTAVMEWLAKYDGQFGAFINGAFQDSKNGFDTCNPATGEVLAKIAQSDQSDVDTAVKAARTTQPAWEASGGPARARVLYAIARLLQKHSRLFAVLETFDNRNPIRHSRDIDVPLAQRHFYFHAGLAQLFGSQYPNHKAQGVCGQIIPWNFPLLMLAWKIAPALAAGNTVVLKPAEYTSLTALLFADICTQAGVPPGVVNIVTGDGAVGEMIVNADVDKIAFTGSTAVGRRIREATAGTGKALTLELGGKSPYIVFEDADMDSAVEGLVDAIWFNQGQVCCAGSRLIVQEGIADRFHAKLKARMDKLRMGDPLDKCIDVGAIVDPVQLNRITAMVDANTAGDTYRAACTVPEGCFYPPTLITGLQTSDTLMQEEIFGPVLVSTTFRTPAEAVEIANNTRYGLAASVWSENINTALDVAPALTAGVVWVNGTNMFDAAAGFGGVRESWFGREGGWEGLLAYCKRKEAPALPSWATPFAGNGAAETQIDRTTKLYIGGKQARPDGGYSDPIYGHDGTLLGHASIASRKDVRNAVEAQKAAKSWGKTTGHLRAQILYFIAENLNARADEFAACLNAHTGQSTGAAEVEEALDALFTFAAWADKFDGAAKGVPMRGLALAIHEPVGKIAALCGDDAPLAGLIRPMAAALTMGNTITLAASPAFPLIAMDMFQVLDTSDVPAGVVNILSGPQAPLAKTMAEHANLEAIWNLSDPSMTADIEKSSAGNLKRTWTGATPSDHQAWLDAATEIKTIWVPYGA